MQWDLRIGALFWRSPVTSAKGTGVLAYWGLYAAPSRRCRKAFQAL